jgi:DNA gyrase inhibitor GyrI
MTYDTSDITPTGLQRCDVGLLIPDTLDPDPEVGVKTLPGGRHIVAKYLGSGRKIADAWEWLVFEHMRRSECVPTTPFGIAAYQSRLPTGWRELLGHLRWTEAELQVPIDPGRLFETPWQLS